MSSGAKAFGRFGIPPLDFIGYRVNPLDHKQLVGCSFVPYFNFFLEAE
jgi:hypothetical protein